MNKELRKITLSPKIERFCQEYVIDYNGKQAAIRTGYSVRSASEQASALLTKTNVKARLKELTDRYADRLGVTKERVVKEYMKIAFFDSRKLYDEEGNFKSMSDLDEETAGAIAGYEVEKIMKGLGNSKKAKVWNKNQALDSLCKALGYNEPEKKEISGRLQLGKDLEEDFS